ncbi:mitotic checkpoint regulator, MAD2B-interacting-domain-containing protein [Hypomontagnella monticulosa]|nr:mitotic checkpoint regulator, MAD2B-interacting-domain-containing protein [Hypomontagnella monticulosa]
MGLVDYSDSESDSEPVAKPIPAPAPQSTTSIASGKKPFQKVVDRAKPGKILVSLPQNSSGRDETKSADGNDGPPAKRARIAGKGGGAFSGFNSFLPPPKNVGKPIMASSSGKTAPRPGINLKTGATPGFSREIDGNGEGGEDRTSIGGDDADTLAKQPSIPAEQKPADQVKLVGKPLMFKPLSVSRKPGKKTATKLAASKATTTAPTPQIDQAIQSKEETPPGPPAKKQKRSLFSISDDVATETETPSSNINGTYEPMFGTEESSAADDLAAYDAQYGAASPYSATARPPTAAPSTSGPESLDAIASSMNLSAAARRELFGRGDAHLSSASTRVVNFNTDAEYAENERLRATGQLEPAYNPLRPVATGGKSSLRQLVTRVQSQRDALEESFAKGHSNRNEAGSRYGWR